MRVEVHFIGNQFIAYDERGNQIKDRHILEQLSFDQMPGFKTSYYVEVASNPSPQQQLDIHINTNID
jgi:hypothetical protein